MGVRSPLRSIGRNATAVESIPGQVGGTCLFKDTRTPVSLV